MRSRLTLLHKLLVLVAIPLIFELFFISQLARELQGAEAESARQAWAYDLVSETNAMSVSMFAVIRTVSSPWAQVKQVPSHQEYLKNRQSVVDSLDHIRALIQQQPSFVEDLQPLDELIRRLLALIDPIELKLQIPNADISLRDVGPLLELVPQVRERARGMGTLALKLREQVESRRENQSRNMRTWLVAAVSFNVLLALGVAVAFNRSTTRRLRRVVENSRRLARGEALLPAIDGGDEIAYLDDTFHDMAQALSEARANEQARTEEIMHILRSMPVGLVIADVNGKLLQCNERFETMVGKSIEFLMESQISLLVSVNGQPAGDFHSLLQVHKTTEIDVLGADGSSTPAHLSTSAIQSSSGTRYLLAFLDVTQKREFERSRQSFVAMVTNELRVPLKQLHEFFAALKQNRHGDVLGQVFEHAELGEASTVRMLRLINDLLDVESVSDGTLVLSKSTASLSHLVAVSIAETAELARVQEISLVHEGDEFDVVVDQDRFVQVLINLISNAIKFSPRGSTVILDTKRLASGESQIRVIDHGRGIPLPMQGAIFEKFRQVTGDDARRGRGTGLGLPICKAIVEKHGGAITLESQPGKGSTFNIELPAAEQPTDSPTARSLPDDQLQALVLNSTAKNGDSCG
jgi:PAS domain S-box-containing protein